MRNKKRIITIGYAHESIRTYKTALKPLGYLVAGLGVACLGVAIFPQGLGFIFYPLGFGLLGSVGIRFNLKRMVADKVRVVKYRYGLIW